MVVIIANKRIPQNKNIAISLTYVYGIGHSLAKRIILKAGVEDKKTFDLTKEEVASIIKQTEDYALEGKLREEVQKKKNIKIRLGTYQGQRLLNGLPVRGQSSRRNSQTARKKGALTRVRKVIAGKKKAPSPK